MPSKGNNAPVTLVSSDGAEFVIDHDAACVSNTIKHMLASKGEEKEVMKGVASGRKRKEEEQRGDHRWPLSL